MSSARMTCLLRAAAFITVLSFGACLEVPPDPGASWDAVLDADAADQAELDDGVPADLDAIDKLGEVDVEGIDLPQDTDLDLAESLDPSPEDVDVPETPELDLVETMDESINDRLSQIGMLVQLQFLCSSTC